MFAWAITMFASIFQKLYRTKLKTLYLTGMSPTMPQDEDWMRQNDLEILQSLQSLSMQAKQSYQPGFDIQDLYSNLIEPGFPSNELIEDCPMLMKVETTTSLRDESSIKRKGRPKGEKNNLERERKGKQVINQGNRRRGHWSVEENKRYHWFLQIYNRHFICKEMRRLDKIFKTMALFIGTREAEQCRSHHQKMQKKYQTFLNIVLYLRRFHYGTEDQENVKEDMKNNQIKQKVQFLNPRELMLEEENIKMPPTPSIIEQAKLDMGMDEPYREIQFQQNIFDFLGENYEKVLHFQDALF